MPLTGSCLLAVHPAANEMLLLRKGTMTKRNRTQSTVRSDKCRSLFFTRVVPAVARSAAHHDTPASSAQPTDVNGVSIESNPVSIESRGERAREECARSRRWERACERADIFESEMGGGGSDVVHAPASSMSMQVMSDIGLHVAPAPQGVGVSNLQQPASSDGYLSAPKLNSRMDGVVYLNRKTARPERWNQAQKSWTCVCDLVSDSKCSGNKQSNRCLNTGKAVSQSLPLKRDCEVPQVAEALANLGEKKSAPLRASESLAVKSLGFVQGTKQGSQIVITDNGRWEGEVGENLAALPKFTVEVSGCSLPACTA